MPEIMLVGEAWGRDEEEARRPFVGASGRLLNSMLSQVGIDRAHCYVTNVFNLRPQPTNDVKNLCGPRAEGIPDMPSLASGKYVRADYEPELRRLYEEVEAVAPNLVVAFGATAAWAFLHTSGIRKVRGAPALSTTPRLSEPVKVLPTYHPAAVLRDFKLRPIVLSDLFKARSESEFPEVRRPERQVWVEPDLADIDRFIEEHIEPSREVSVDIETLGTMVTEIGFAPRRDIALVIPFYDARKSDKNYWPDHASERRAWLAVKRILESGKRLVFQNGMYDMTFLWRAMGLASPGAEDDTMLLHHALQPEMEKGLAFLGTIYTNEAAWKFMRKSSTIKRED